MIEHLIKEHTEAMRALTHALREHTAVMSLSVGNNPRAPVVGAQVAPSEVPKMGVPVADLECLVAEGNAKAEKTEGTKPEAWTFDTAREKFLAVCRTVEGKTRAAAALNEMGKTRLSEVPEDQLGELMAKLA